MLLVMLSRFDERGATDAGDDGYTAMEQYYYEYFVLVRGEDSCEGIERWGLLCSRQNQHL